MSLIPLIFNDHWYSMRPSRIMDQHFGVALGLDDLLSPVNSTMVKRPSGYYRPWQSAASRVDAGSTVTADKAKFHVNLDVQQFKPEEITVKVTDNNTITVEGKHEETEDEHGFVSRHFIRRYVLPGGHDIKNVVSSLSSDGVLSITAPRVEREDEHRTIAIQQTGVPFKPIENKKLENQGNQ